MSDAAQQLDPVETGAAETPTESRLNGAVEDPFESRARRMGWVGKEEFRGDGGAQWVDAETFVRRAEQSADILIERNKALDRRLEQSEKTFGIYKQNSEKQLKEMSDQLKELQDTLVDFRDFATSANKRAYQKARTDLQAEMRKAVAEADVERFDAIKNRVDELDQEAAEYVETRQTRQRQQTEEQPKPNGAAQAEVTTQEAPPPPPEVQAWVSRNQWFINPDFSYMNQYAQRMHMHLMRTEPALTLQANLEKVTELTRKKFPEEFGINPRREEAAVTASGVTTTTRATARKKLGYDDLPAEAKLACDKYVKTIPNYTKEEYVRVYFMDEDEQ
jgi:ElaB/YqjD/DUF883 family membrane-anchored ribosome-binding protein